MQVTTDLDRIASLFEQEHETLGISKKIADDFGLRCDILSTAVEKTAGIDRSPEGKLEDPELVKLAQMDPTENYTEDEVKSDEFDPSEIGRETPGALLRNTDEPYMDVFRQDEYDQLREVQQTGMFSNAKTAAALVRKMAALLARSNVPLPVAQRKTT
jgi:hypothetical protein